MTQDNKVFHITVGTSPSSKPDLLPELRVLKAALLYADKVKFCSVSSSLILGLAVAFANMKEKDIPALLNYRRNSEIDRYNVLKRQKRRTKQELIEYQRLKSKLAEPLKTVLSQVQQDTMELVVNAGVEGLFQAINSGLVDLHPFMSKNIKDWIGEFFDVVSKTVIAKETYPLFDTGTGELLNYAFREGKLDPSHVATNKAKQVGLASQLLQRLPLFDDASVDEIIDIRKELGKPLIRFRAAVMNFSDDITNAAWNEEFPQEVEQVFRKQVEPAILDIEDAYKSNSALVNFVLRMSKVGVPSSLGLLFGQATDLPLVTVIALGLGVAGSAVSGLETRKEWLEHRSELEQNQLYLYYKAGNQLSKNKNR